MYPIGSMYGIYGNIYHQYTPFMLAYIPAPWILWDIFPFCWMMWKIMTFTKPKQVFDFFSGNESHPLFIEKLVPQNNCLIGNLPT